MSAADIDMSFLCIMIIIIVSLMYYIRALYYIDTVTVVVIFMDVNWTNSLGCF